MSSRTSAFGRVAGVCAAGLFLLSLPSISSAQDNVFSWKVPVTYYDLHSDGSNPEFEVFQGGPDNLCPQLLASTLNADRRPVRNPALGKTDTVGLWWVDHIDAWFRDWSRADSVTWVSPSKATVTCRVDSSRRDTLILDPDTIYQYNYRKCDTVITPPITHISDTAFKNVRIDDTLAILADTSSGITAAGFYGDKFFPIDGKGFGAETGASPHNYSFTLQMHNRMKYTAGATISTASDDDSWIFIDNKLALDNGGAHATKTRAITLDSIGPALGLTPNTTYNFDLFFVERHSGGSVLNFDMSGITLLDRTIGAGVIGGHARMNPFSGVAIALGNGGRLMVPRATARIALLIADLQGRTLVDRMVSNPSGPIELGRSSTGRVAIVKARCMDRNNRPLGVVSARLIQAR